ncbi:tetratricopeptide repeat protein [Riemerella anatipestifer]|uniref:tetratricopeptide repeat protein n=1 Tax=Riemerella anatipestifer TaxID=34085 RepID=UPI00285B92EA|nr:tetratricopeptide repeat protein [Riemerella anatipestifer]MDR7794597.1 tetratricopeptide repeat protein [Riemerella anatipestifer]
MSYKGNREYDSKNYDKASSYFLEAIKKRQDFGGHYNLGNTLYKREMYSEAKAEYQKALSLAKTKEDKMAALYNLGNAEMKAQNYDKAAEFYKKALQQDPYNESIRKNYNISKLKQKEKNQSKSNNKSQNQNSEQDKSQDNQQKKSEQESPQNSDKNKDGGGANEKDKGQGTGQTPKPDNNSSENKRGMSKEEENRIMQRLESKERDAARRILNKNSYIDPKSNEKDW